VENQPLTAVVTGASSGLGLATATALAQKGWHVTGLDLSPFPSTLTPPVTLTLMTVDVTDAAAVSQALTEVTAAGSAPLRLVVNCAGIAPGKRLVGSDGPHDLATFQKTIQVNLVGTFVVMAQAASVMAASEPDSHGERGVIINTSSVAAFEGQIGQVAYAASKAGVAGMTLPAARDLARHGIRVMTIAPGIVDTPMMAGFSETVRDSLASSVPFPQRLAHPDEFAELVQMIYSHRYLNGETIRMDGALRMAPK
jgi:NAD(P)-dependent dehydrogenase (short-subunit alcohol dehydrogenase family)